MASRTRALLCAWRLSMITICPACKVGARTCSIYSSKAVVLADPSRISAAPMPSRESAAMSVVFLPRFRGTLPLARSPFGARAYRGAKAMLEPHSSRNTNASVGSLLAFSRPAGPLLLVALCRPERLFFPSGQKTSRSGGSPALLKGGKIGLALVAEAKALEVLALGNGGLPSQFAPAGRVKLTSSLL